MLDKTRPFRVILKYNLIICFSLALFFLREFLFTPVYEWKYIMSVSILLAQTGCYRISQQCLTVV
jgi:hypothetical protein